MEQHQNFTIECKGYSLDGRINFKKTYLKNENMFG